MAATGISGVSIIPSASRPSDITWNVEGVLATHLPYASQRGTLCRGQLSSALVSDQLEVRDVGVAVEITGPALAALCLSTMRSLKRRA